MTGVVVELKLRNFVEWERFVEKLPHDLTRVFRKTMSRWYYETLLPEIQHVITTGISEKFPYRNRSARWAAYKSNRWGVNHSLGRLSGRLHDEVARAHPSFDMDGGSTTMHLNFTQPYYLRFLEGRGKYHYPPIASAYYKQPVRKQLETNLIEDLDTYIKQHGGK